MTTDTIAPGCHPGANQEHSTEILDQPSLPALSEEENILLELQRLAQSGPDEIAEELRLKALAKQSGTGVKILRNAYQKIRAELVREAERREAEEPIELTPEEAALAEEEKALFEEQARVFEAQQAKLAERVMALQQRHDLFQIFHELLKRSGYICNDYLAASVFLSHGARLLPDSTAFFFTGASASGKSSAALKGAEFLPPEEVLSITSVSDQALHYLGDIKHKYIIFGEMTPPVDGQDDPRQMAVRQLISENKIIRATVEKPDGKTNAMVFKVTEGPCVCLASTTREPKSFHDELQNRAAWVTSDDSTATTKAVLAAVAQRAANPVQEQDDELKEWVEVFQEYHRTLKQLPVVIPYATSIEPAPVHVTARRLFPMLLNYVRANALLHQHSRERHIMNGKEVIIATLADYEMAYKVIGPSAPRVLETCPAKARKVFDETIRPSMTDVIPLTTSEIQRLVSEPPSTVRRWLKDFEDAGLLIRVDGRQGRQNAYILGDVSCFHQELGLVSPEKLRQLIAWARLL